MKFDAGPPWPSEGERAARGPGRRHDRGRAADRVGDRVLPAAVNAEGRDPADAPARNRPRRPPPSRRGSGSCSEGPAEREPRVLLDCNVGLVADPAVASLHGVMHSVSPGHGKTMVAAYLIGEQGTPRHAVILGLIVTLTHTSTAFVVALCSGSFCPGRPPRTVQAVLGVGGGALVAFIGLWLLMARLGGRSDHVHLGAHSHAHCPQPFARRRARPLARAHARAIRQCELAPADPARHLRRRGPVLGRDPVGPLLRDGRAVRAGRLGGARLQLRAGLRADPDRPVGRVGRAGRGGRFGGRPWFRVVSKWLPIVGAALVVVDRAVAGEDQPAKVTRDRRETVGSEVCHSVPTVSHLPAHSTFPDSLPDSPEDLAG